jgi:hypothetical protein
MTNEPELPHDFICIASLKVGRRLIRARRERDGSYWVELWSAAGYWSSSGGGETSETQLRALIQGCKEMMTVQRVADRSR